MTLKDTPTTHLIARLEEAARDLRYRMEIGKAAPWGEACDATALLAVAKELQRRGF